MQYEHICGKCRKEFTNERKKSKYCSPECYIGRRHRINDNGQTEKQCTKCGEWKPMSFEYYGHTYKTIDSFACYCKTCCSAKGKTIEVIAYRKEFRARPHIKEQRSQYAKTRRATPEWMGRDTTSEKKYEAQQRNLLTDRIVKRAIYIGSGSKIKYNQMTPEMIINKRADILSFRLRKEAIRVEREMNPSVPKEEYRVCIICGNVFEVKGKSLVCGDKCRNVDSLNKYYTNRENILEQKRDKYRSEWQPPPPFKCRECGEMYQPKYGETRRDFCSDRCANKHMHRRAEPRKRARQNGVFYEYVNPRKVFERDGWRCQLCGKKLSPKRRGTCHSDAPELDHIITWNDGGEHSYRNTQCSCRKCNEIKGAASQGQLRMFG